MKDLVCVQNRRIQEAFRKVSRIHFLPEEWVHLEDATESALPTLEGATSPAPQAIAQLLELLDVQPHHCVLEVGTGTGYTAALLSHLCAEVYTIERLEPLALQAKQLLQQEGIENVHVFYGNGFRGVESHAPFDRVLLSATLRHTPESLKRQLKIGGRLVGAFGPHQIRQRVVVITRTGEREWEETQEGTIEFSSLLGDLLVDMGVVARDVVETIASQTKNGPQRLGETLLAEGYIHESDLYAALARQRGLKTAPLDVLLSSFEPSLLKNVSLVFLEKNQIIPLSRDGDSCRLATMTPDINLSALAQVLGVYQFDIYLVSPTDYRRLWSAIRLGRAGTEVQEKHIPASPEQELLSSAAESHLLALFEALLLDAVSERASDIHLERYEEEVFVRFRVDGQLRDIKRYQLTSPELQGLVNVIKISSGLDIAERRLPQGGRFRRRTGERIFDLRVQTQPTMYGEHVVIRLLPQNINLLSIEDLGFPEGLGKEYRRLLRSPQGLVLVVGPTGSGKSTTLYAGLQELAEDRTRKVLTIEDPIEYAIRHVQQSQVRPDIGFAFQHAMRAFVREDPDVILVGEIRDGETALEAIRASQTGHLVLSTLHCNDTVDAVQRLFDLGMHPNSIASELIAVVAQRLARRICSQCRHPVAPAPELVAEIFPQGVPEDFVCYEGQGCQRCAGFGVRGRIALIELLHVSAPIRRVISNRPVVDDLRTLAYQEGLTPMRENALALVQQGVVALSELPRHLSLEQLAPWGTRHRA